MQAILLAAGFSSRMGRLKQVLPIAGVPMVRHIAATLHDAGLRVVVVVGHREAEVREALSAFSCDYVRNSAPERGMFASVQCGCALVEPGQGCLVMPGDCPGVRVATIRHLHGLLRIHATSVIIPTYQGQRGHPVGVPAHIVRRVVTLPPSTPGLRTLWQTERVLPVPVDDPAILRDLDRPEDLAAQFDIAGS